MAVQDTDLRLAAEVLDAYAELLRQSYTVSGEWPPDAHSQDVRAECEAYRALAKRLREAA